MCKRAMLLLLTLMMVPSFASAATYWQINATASPTALKSNLTAVAPTLPGDYATTLNLTKVTSLAIQSVNFNVADVPGKTVIVKVDGVVVVPASGVFTVNKGTLLNHNVIAYYSQVALNTLTSKVAAGGTITPSQTYTSNGIVTVTPFAGYTLTGVIIGGTTYALADTLPGGVSMAPTATGATYTFASGSYAVQGVFAVVAAAKAIISNGATLTVTPGASVVLDGTASSSNVAGTTYVWTTTAGTLTANADPKKVTFTAPATGASTVTLTVTAGSVVKTADITITAVQLSKADLSNICIDCHNGTDGPSSAGYLKSSHLSTSYGPASCQDCHNPNNDLSHAYASSYTACNNCHTPGGTYGIYVNMTTTTANYKAPHGQGKAAPTAGAANVGDSITQYVTQGAICNDCHGHNNTINKGFAEGGHGKVSNEPLNPFTHYDWSYRTNNGTRQNGNCDRCHTAVGFIKMLGQDPVLQTRLALQAGKPNNVLICVGCHKTAEGALRTDATPAGNPTPLTGGYFALFSSSAANITTGNTKIQVSFPGYKNSSICIPCHSGRTTNTVFAETYAKSALASKNYSTLQNSIYQHAKNMAQTFTGQGAYDFSGQLATIGASSHAGVKMGASDTQGPCVGCHYSKTGTTHSLEVVVSDANCSATACHPAGFSSDSLKVSEENYKAGVKALDALIRNKFAPLWASGSNDLAGERTGYWRYGRFMKTAVQGSDVTTATKAYGAWYNWQILALYDSAAYAHNTNYARKILVDTIDYLDDGIINSSASATIAGINIIVPGALTAAELTAAADFTNGIATSNIMKRHADTSAATYKVQYTLPGTTAVTCATCHNPSNETVLQSEARKAWADSGHGETIALPWIPGSTHLWRSSGNTNNFADAASGTDCVRCHTPEGFAQFVGGTPFTNVNPVASAANAVVNSPLNCNACHVNALNATSDRLVVPQVTTYYNISSAGVQKSHIAATYPNVGESNMCIPCHAGRVSGSALADASTKGFNFTTGSFQNSHYMAAAGLMYAKVGFTAYTTATTQSGNGKGAPATYGQTMTSNEDGGLLTSTHRKLGTTAIRGDSHNLGVFVAGNFDTQGPCVTCHLQGYNNAGTKRPGAGHSLEVKSASWDQVCTNCHAAEAGYATDGTPLLVEEQKIPFDTAMSILKSLVQTKLSCEFDSSAYPYFFKAGFAHTSANAFKAFGNVKNEGAAFNLNLLAREPYAYVHARTYTRRLIYDSIDYLDDGLMNQSVGSYLTTSGIIGAKPVDATGITANDQVWQYLNAYDRTTKAWYSPLERP